MSVPESVEQGSSFSPLGIGAALVAGALGAAAWAGLSIFANFEVGYLAWGVGGLVGLAAVKFGGRGTPMAVAAAAISLLAIFGGKIIAMESGVDNMIEESTSETVYFSYVDGMRNSAAALSELGENPTDQQLRQMLSEQQLIGSEPVVYTDQDIADFRAYEMPEINAFSQSQPTYEDWSAAGRERIEFVVDSAEAPSASSVRNSAPSISSSCSSASPPRSEWSRKPTNSAPSPTRESTRAGRRFQLETACHSRVATRPRRSRRC